MRTSFPLWIVYVSLMSVFILTPIYFIVNYLFLFLFKYIMKYKTALARLALKMSFYSLSITFVAGYITSYSSYWFYHKNYAAFAASFIFISSVQLYLINKSLEIKTWKKVMMVCIGLVINLPYLYLVR